ncbi:mucoidy inhibitor MuiA family protein [Synoicihabitans lomoniglobus]|uniref:Mucoidy inhibitor MuiA family protein n=1 Tax=Synoicihabitans lomoniglobus TaxID=2909285 RepID=A0AAF0A0A0_9BACT|nr:mucoidy inhibitor MuiA family protein [Opitutaceae bacterium LMO-M01]WED64858.1 mucoidy inhibitor MuiA family protein [Opitutaceae bacterium LMO-M01]
MKTSLRPFFAFAAIFAILASLSPLVGATDSTIRAVTVYPDRALVARTAGIELGAGESTIVLSGLPANLWDNSLQVRGSGPDGTSIVDVQSRNLFVDATPNPEIRSLEDKLKTLRAEDASLADEAKALEYDHYVLERIVTATTTPPTEGDAAQVDFDNWSKLLAFSRENTQRINAAQQELNQRREALRNRIAAAENQLNEARGRQPGRRAVKEVTVRLSSPTSGVGQLHLSYTVPGAQWTPVYSARLDSTARSVAFDYQAQVINRTGEAWTNVALTLSTARPSAGGAAPEPTPWIVEEQRYRNPNVMTTQALSDSVRMEKTTLAGARYEAPMADMAVAQATVETGLTAATFKIAAPASIPTDGTMQKVTVTTITLPAGLRYDTTPKYVPSAFLTAKVTNDSAFPLLGGTLAAFVDGAFITNSHLKQTMPGEAFELALGVDEAVAIERTLINRFVEKTGFTNSGLRTTYEIKTEVTNHKTIPISIALAEPLPVSRHEKIIVKLIEPAERDLSSAKETKAYTRDDEGILTWTGSLAPGATRTLTYKFSIEHPADMDVTGVE